MKENKRFIIISVLGILLFILFTVKTFLKETQKITLPVYGQVSNFTLMDAISNKPFTLRQLEGKVWVADFIFTTCSDICPTMSKNMASLHRSYEAVDGVQLVSISVNPEYDSPEVLQVYAKKYRANPKKWHFLTGKREVIKDLSVKSFKLGDIKDPVFHSSRFALVDKKGLIRGYYDGTDKVELRKLFKAISVLVKEK